MFGEFESHFRTFKPRYFTNIYTNFSIFRMVIMFVIDFFIYTFLGYYLQMVLPHTYGIRKPFYFIFTSEYWCGKTPKYSKLTLTDTTSTKSDLSIKAMDQTQNNETLFQKYLAQNIKNFANIADVSNEKKYIDSIFINMYSSY